MQQLLLTRQEIEQRLEDGLVNKVIVFTDIYGKKRCGKVNRLAVWPDKQTEELMVVFHLNNWKIECDLRYFTENTEIQYGNTYTGDRRDVRSILRQGN